MILLEEDDLVKLNKGSMVRISEPRDKEPYFGDDYHYSVEFYEHEISCIAKHNVKPNGGDDTNYWLFYTGSGCNQHNKFNIANWAKFYLREFNDMSIDQIMTHIYWGTESSQYKHMYNGDTFVLYIDLKRLPEDMQYDAQL